VTSTGLTFTPLTAAPVDMMQQNLSRMGGPIKLMSRLERNIKPLAHQFFSDLEVATRNTDAILYSTLAFAGYHVAEKPGIPVLVAYNMPNQMVSEITLPLPVRNRKPGYYNFECFREGTCNLFKLLSPLAGPSVQCSPLFA